MSSRRVVCQDAGMGASGELLKLFGPELELLLPELDEKARRLMLGAVARAAGDGGIGAVARLTGASWQTVADGAAELESGQSVPEGRVRRPGGGRRKLAETDPGLVPALLALVTDSARVSAYDLACRSAYCLTCRLGPGVWRLDYGMGGAASVAGLWFFIRQLGPLMVMTSQWWRKRSRMAVARTSSVKTWPHSLKVLLLVMMTE